MPWCTRWWSRATTSSRIRRAPRRSAGSASCSSSGPSRASSTSPRARDAARILADAFGCRVTCVENAPEFAAVAREQRLPDLIEVVEADAKDSEIEPGALRRRLVPWRILRLRRSRRDAQPAEACRAVRRRGEPYWRAWPLPGDVESRKGGRISFPCPRRWPLRVRGRALVSLIDSSLDDWDRYETLHWLALDDWWPRIRAIPTPRSSGSAGGAIASSTFAGSATCSAGPSSYAVG